MKLERLKAGLEQMVDPQRINGGQILHKLEDIINANQELNNSEQGAAAMQPKA